MDYCELDAKGEVPGTKGEAPDTKGEAPIDMSQVPRARRHAQRNLVKKYAIV